RFGQLSRPMYKPQHWDKVQELDMWTNKYDPVMTCQPLGVPRQGPPRRIYQTDNDVTFIYLGRDASRGESRGRALHDALTRRITTSPSSIWEAMPAVDMANIASSRPITESVTQ